MRLAVGQSDVRIRPTAQNLMRYAAEREVGAGVVPVLNVQAAGVVEPAEPLASAGVPGALDERGIRKARCGSEPCGSPGRAASAWGAAEKLVPRLVKRGLPSTRIPVSAKNRP